ncbi:HNH endonuclease [Streptomyces sp. W16]|uniref:HNH endonuclease n=1 Tax=Streptomyces sp. W16 TaxID=3076631 RepID=UPI00295B5F8F|nr:HNH endonuclease [Streptomyces sp. W16]MDV9171035.1 HNH endonuclease [Streptomyces sp. W16]
MIEFGGVVPMERGADALPDWRNDKLPLMAQAALWLLAVVGEGEVFTKQQLREAFPASSQVDRRIRDLRDHGWVIETRRSDFSLALDEMRFKRAGGPVWDPAARARTSRRVTSGVRRLVFERDGHACTRCGRPAGEVVLEMAHLAPLGQGGAADELSNLITLCPNCHATMDRRGNEQPAEADVAEAIDVLSPLERSRLLAWVAMGRRPVTDVDRAWHLYQMLPPAQRDSIKVRLAEAVDGHAYTETLTSPVSQGTAT